MAQFLTKIRCEELLKATIHAVDGDLGKLKDVYFDDASWAIRYLIVDTGHWLPGRKVLIAPHSLVRTEPDEDRIAVNLTREQIRDSPDIDTDKPVSRQQEAKLGGYYGWPPVPPAPIVGAGMLVAGYTWPFPGTEPPPDPADLEDYDPHLRSVHEVTGYSVEAADGEIGSMKDVVLDLIASRVPAVIVDTSGWPGKHEVAVPVASVQEISWEDRKVKLRVLRAALESAPQA